MASARRRDIDVADASDEQGCGVRIDRLRRATLRRAAAAGLLTLALTTAVARGSESGTDALLGPDSGSGAHIDAARVFARMGESCVYGAVAGATSALLTTGPYLSGAWVLPPMLTLGMSAAGVGCVVASSGAAAAELYRQAWSGDLGGGATKQ
jgi:hypothetical protein